MPNEEFPVGTLLSRRNVFSGVTRLYRVRAGGHKKLILERADGPLQGHLCTVSVKQANNEYRRVK